MTHPAPAAPRRVGRTRSVLAPVAAVLAVLAVLLTSTATPAVAHDSLVSSTPKDGSTVAEVPSEVALTFDEPAQRLGTSLVVTGPRGQVQTGTPRLVGATVRQSLATGAPAGHYVVAWRVTSVDGHPVSGTFAFTATAARPGTYHAVAGPASRPASAAARHGGGLFGARLAVGATVLLAVAIALAVRQARIRRGREARA